MGRTACTEPQCLYKGALLPHLLHRDMTSYQVGCTSYGDKNTILWFSNQYEQLLQSDGVVVFCVRDDQHVTLGHWNSFSTTT
jgi:hypothetical protein